MNGIEVRFHLVGGQSVTFHMPLEEGKVVTPDVLQETAKQWRDSTNLWMSQNAEWAFVISDMKNVAMIEIVNGGA